MRIFAEFLAHPTQTNAIASSSRFLAKTVLDDLDLAGASAILEYGAGTGAFTGHILKHVKPDSKFVAIEINPRLAKAFRARYPEVSLVEDTVANVRTICDNAGIEQVDCIVSSLPWAGFSEETQVEFLETMMGALKPGGRFVTFGYMHGLLIEGGSRFAKLLPRYFRSVSRSKPVWLNLPPAFVYRCSR